MGFFGIGRTTNGQRECLLDPQGSPFFSIGVVHTGAYTEGEGHSFLKGRYGGDWARLARKIVSDLREWGFNSAGYHNHPEMMSLIPSMQDMYPAPVSYWMGRPTYPDVFDPRYRDEVNRLALAICAHLREHTNLMGYYWTDTPQWDPSGARQRWDTDWVSAIRSMGPSAPGKRRYIGYLYETVQDRGEMRLYTGSGGQTYDDLLQSRFHGLDVNHPVVVQHDRGFLRLIAREYYSIAAHATRGSDPNHLLFGDRYLQVDIPSEVLEEAVPYLDVVSIQPTGITFDKEYFGNLHALTGKPIMICDHAVSFPTPGYPETVWPQRPTEKAAAQAYSAYLWAAFQCPHVIGYHRCQYIDRITQGGIVLKQGLLQADETPYSTLIDDVRRANLEVLAAFSDERTDDTGRHT